MKKIIIMRHANALNASECGATSDSERTLSPEGEANAEKAALELKNTCGKPEAIISSPLKRAFQTAKIISDFMAMPEPSRDSALAEQDTAKILKLLKEKLESADSVLIVGHQPSVGVVSELLAGEAVYFSPASFSILEPDYEKFRKEPERSARLIGKFSPS